MGQTLERPGPLRPAERLVLATLFGLRAAADEHLRTTAAVGGLDPLVSAAAATRDPRRRRPRSRPHGQARAGHSAGTERSRARSSSSGGIARRLPRRPRPSRRRSKPPAPGAPRRPAPSPSRWPPGRGASPTRAPPSKPGAPRAARRKVRRSAHWPPPSWPSARGDGRVRFKGTRPCASADGTSEVAIRAIASLEQVDLVAEMNALADELGDGVRGAVARLEAVTLGERVTAGADADSPPRQRAQGGAVRASDRRFPRGADRAPVGRRRRDPAMDPRRAEPTQPIPPDSALDGVREALLGRRSRSGLLQPSLREAHLGTTQRPSRCASSSSGRPTQLLDDRAAWREERAAEAKGDAHVLLLLEAARENERAGDEPDGALRCAEAGGARERGVVARVARERAELRDGAGRAARRRSASRRPRIRRAPFAARGAFERLGGPRSPGARRILAAPFSGISSIFEEQPTYKPSLRYLEQHLISEGRDDEIEPIASAITHSLREGHGVPSSAPRTRSWLRACAFAGPPGAGTPRARWWRSPRPTPIRRSGRYGCFSLIVAREAMTPGCWP